MQLFYECYKNSLGRYIIGLSPMPILLLTAQLMVAETWGNNKRLSLAIGDKLFSHNLSSNEFTPVK